MDYLNKQQNPQPSPAPPETAAALADIDARESDIRDQFKAGKLPPSVFKTWLAEFAREREALTRRTTTPPKSARITRSDFLQEYKRRRGSTIRPTSCNTLEQHRRGTARSKSSNVVIVLQPEIHLYKVSKIDPFCV